MLHDDKERFTNTIYQTVVLISHIAIRARKYDAIINDFISKNPLSMVVNLGCGFDTRYWRIDHQLKTFSERFYHS